MKFTLVRSKDTIGTLYTQVYTPGENAIKGPRSLVRPITEAAKVK